MPLGSSSAASSTAVSGLIVEWIAMTVPGLACAASSVITSRTCSSLSTVMLMMSAVATSATSSAKVAPSSASGVIASVRTSKTVTPPGHSTSRLAIGAPMFPKPDVPQLQITS